MVKQKSLNLLDSSLTLWRIIQLVQELLCGNSVFQPVGLCILKLRWDEVTYVLQDFLLMNSSSKEFTCNQSEQVASGPLVKGCWICPSAKHTQQPLGAWGCPCTQPHIILKWKTMLLQIRKNSRRRVVFSGGLWGVFSVFYCFTSPFHLSVSWGWSGGFLMCFFFPSHNAVENYSAFSYFFIKTFEEDI